MNQITARKKYKKFRKTRDFYDESYKIGTGRICRHNFWHK